MEDNWISIHKATQIFGVSRTKIKNLIKHKLISLNKEGKVSEQKVRAVLEAQKQEKINKIKEEQDYTEIIKKANALYRTEKAKLVELQRKEKEGILINKREVEKLLVEIGNNFKKKLLSWKYKLPPKLEPKLPNKTKKQILKILDEEIEELLSDFHKYGVLNETKK